MIRHLVGWIADANISKQYSITVVPMHQLLEVVICSIMDQRSSSDHTADAFIPNQILLSKSGDPNFSIEAKHKASAGALEQDQEKGGGAL